MITVSINHSAEISSFVNLTEDLMNYRILLGLTSAEGLIIEGIRSPMFCRSVYSYSPGVKVKLHTNPYSLVTSLICSNISDNQTTITLSNYFESLNEEFELMSEGELESIFKFSDECKGADLLLIDNVIFSNRKVISLMVEKLTKVMPTEEVLVEGSFNFIRTFELFCKEIIVKSSRDREVGLNLINSSNLNNAMYCINQGKGSRMPLTQELIATCTEIVTKEAGRPFIGNSVFHWGDLNNICVSVVLTELLYLKIKEVCGFE